VPPEPFVAISFPVDLIAAPPALAIFCGQTALKILVAREGFRRPVVQKTQKSSNEEVFGQLAACESARISEDQCSKRFVRSFALSVSEDQRLQAV
jgi:hypothetical protein